MFQVFVSIWSICKYFTLFPYNRIPYQTQLPAFRDQHSLLPVLQRFRGLNPELYQVWCHTIRTPTNGAISLQGSRLWCFSSVGLVLFGSKRDNERMGALVSQRFIQRPSNLHHLTLGGSISSWMERLPLTTQYDTSCQLEGAIGKSRWSCRSPLNRLQLKSSNSTDMLT